MARVADTLQPYAYPPEAHRRRHGPSGYAHYREYLPWLEDEFSFRCVYCLKRMVWAPTDIWTIDHLISRDDAPEGECDYENLVFACQFCNSRKGPNHVPDPCQVGYGACLRVESDGTITPLNKSGRRLEKVLRRNHTWQVQERQKMIRLLAIVAEHDEMEFERLMRFPSELPDLGRMKPPLNRRPEGVSQSWFAKRQRGELPKLY